MSSPMAFTKLGEIDNAEKRRKLIISFVGCGPVGVLNACLFADAGLKVACADVDPVALNLLVKGKTISSKREMDARLKSHIRTGRLSLTNDVKTAVSNSDIIAIAVPIKINGNKKLDLSDLEKTCKLIGKGLRNGVLVIMMSVAPTGFMDGKLRELLEDTSGLKSGSGFGLAYSPSPMSSDQTFEAILDRERVVAAADKASLDAASNVIAFVWKKGLKKTSNLRVAEQAVLFGATRRDVNVCLNKEFAIFCEKARLDFKEVQQLFEENLYALSSRAPSDSDMQEESYLVLEDAENLGTNLRIVSAAKEVNEEIVKHLVSLISDSLRRCGKTLRRAKIAVLGISQTPNEKGRPQAMLQELSKMLEAKGAKLVFYDPYFLTAEADETVRRSCRTLSESADRADCVLLTTGHDQFKRLNLRKLKFLMRTSPAIVDLGGILEPGKVEREGFIYRGLGRGVWTK